MSHDILDELEKSETNPSKVVFFLTMPDAYHKTSKEHMMFLDTLNAATNMLDLFITLNKYWDHFNYHLLKKLITAPRIDTHMNTNECQRLQAAMKKYIEEMDAFRRQTHIDVCCKIFVNHEEKVLEGFTEVVTEHKLTEMKTLQDIEDYRQRLAQQYNLQECLVFMKNVRPGSVVITWWIPCEAADSGMDSQPCNVFMKGNCYMYISDLRLRDSVC